VKMYGDSRDGGFSDLAAFGPGMRVEMHPATDRWARGDRYGEVRKVTRRYVHVLMDRSGRTIRAVPGNIGAIVETHS
jgi:hypothetical protein